jgi:hypothetical protein
MHGRKQSHDASVTTGRVPGQVEGVPNRPLVVAHCRSHHCGKRTFRLDKTRTQYGVARMDSGKEDSRSGRSGYTF